MSEPQRRPEVPGQEFELNAMLADAARTHQQLATQEQRTQAAPVSQWMLIPYGNQLLMQHKAQTPHEAYGSPSVISPPGAPYVYHSHPGYPHPAHAAYTQIHNSHHQAMERRQPFAPLQPPQLHVSPKPSQQQTVPETQQQCLQWQELSCSRLGKKGVARQL